MKKAFLFVCVLSMGTVAWAQTAPPLGSAQSFAVLGASTVTNTGATIITGDLGVSPGTSCTGFPAPCTGGPGVVNGTIYVGAGSLAGPAQSDAAIAYGDLVAEACGTNLSGKILGTSPGAVTLAPGVYCFNSSAQLTGILTLSGSGIYVFQMKSTLTTAANSSVVLTNGATAANVFWQVGSSSTLGAGTVFVGSILAYTSDTLDSGASVTGRVVALGAAVTLIDDTITVVAPPVTQPCKDYTTGGGFITGPSGGKAAFGFEAGCKCAQDKDGSLRGEFVYHDQGIDMTSTSVTAYLETGPNSRRIQGTAEINGQDGTYQLDVSDNGSGTHSCAIRLSTGYSASGEVKGGQIEIHRCYPSGKDDHGKGCDNDDHGKGNDKDDHGKGNDKD